ncbi:MAG: hypothetical protein K9N05_04590 [Candidatus Marinimicrobia bacterium]|nr:hypothetical protein [Candidatus Neomarinimicrobiota bacterium]
MELHLVSGFLGSGKTTSIITLCKHLMQKGKKVAVVTNDQGKYLVDTAFFRASDIPATEVQSGCFCSNYQDLVEQLDELCVRVGPDVVFAESIGSAGNLVGTVLQPLLNTSKYTPSSLSAIVDARLFLRLLHDEPLPFSDSVSATFRSQLNESDLLIINKIDLLSSDDIKEIKFKINEHFPDKKYLFQSAFSTSDIQNWYNNIRVLKVSEMKDSGLNSQLHQRALLRLKWMERVYDLKSKNNVFDEIHNIIDTMLKRLSGTPRAIAHIKAYIEYNGKYLKIGITSLNENDWQDQLHDLFAHSAKVIINARIHSDDDIDDLFIL